MDADISCDQFVSNASLNSLFLKVIDSRLRIMPKVFKPKIKVSTSSKLKKSESVSDTVVSVLPALEGDSHLAGESIAVENSATVGQEPSPKNVKSKAEPQKTYDIITTRELINMKPFEKTVTFPTSQPLNVDMDAVSDKSPGSLSKSVKVKLFAVKQNPRKHAVYGEAPPPADKPLDRSTVTLRSLLNWIPANKPPPRIREINPNPKPLEPEGIANTEVGNDVRGKEENKSVNQDESVFDPFAPQLRLDADGNIVLDEQSLHVSHPVDDEAAIANRRHVCEEAGLYGTNYNSFRKKPIQHRGRKWSEKDTTRFYRALSTIGTDFYCMTKLFPDRTRGQLLKKFKREERLFPHLVDNALKNKRNYDITAFYNSESDSDERYNRLTKAAIAEKRNASKGKSNPREPRRLSTCDISALIDEVLARDAEPALDAPSESEKSGIESREEGDDVDETDEPPLKAQRISRRLRRSAPMRLAEMIEKTATEAAEPP